MISGGGGVDGTNDGLRICIAGAPIDNANRGVVALGRSVIDTIDGVVAGARVSVFDDGFGVRPTSAGRYSATTVEQVGVRVSRRWHRPESWAQIRAAQVLRVPAANPVARRIAEADVLLDLSGGDSFTDLYGLRRFRVVNAPKHAALRARSPLVLLPQTYGPFASDRTRREAALIIRSASLSYARDSHSYQHLLELAGPDADVSSLREGVDVAFALVPRRPSGSAAEHIESLSRSGLLVGVNVSGLLTDDGAQQRFGLDGDYLTTMIQLVEHLVAQGAHVLFVPHVHVHDRPPGTESDAGAVAALRANLSADAKSQTLIAPLEWGAAELKWAVGQCAWFAGSRMHSTIAALSSHVPAFGYAYSDKTKGVFATCDMAEHVADARSVSGEPAVERMLCSFAERKATRERLATTVPPVTERARGQLVEVLDAVAGWRDQARGARR